jgi:transketolase
MTYEDFLLQAASIDPRVVVLTAENRAAIRALPSSLGERFIDVGIAEQTLIGVAAGLALRGRIPVAHALSAFLTMRAFEFIRTDVGIARLPVKLVGSVAGFLSEANGPTHQAIEDVALMRLIPSMNVFCPADLVELVAGMAVILLDSRPWYIRYTAAAPAVEHVAPFEIGRAEILAHGTDLTVLTYGHLVEQCVGAVAELAASGIHARLLNMRTLKPVDCDAVFDAASRTHHLVVVEDHIASGGLGTIVAEQLVSHRFAATLDLISLGDRWFRPALLHDVLEHEGFSAKRLARRIAAMLPARSDRLGLSA